MSSDGERLTRWLLPGINTKKKGGSYDGVYQLIIESKEPLYLYIIICSGGLHAVKEGIAGKPDVVISTTSKDLKDLITGELGSISALLTGRIKIKGDLALAKRVIALFKKNKSM
jgi:putative sterol carrier protein